MTKFLDDMRNDELLDREFWRACGRATLSAQQFAFLAIAAPSKLSTLEAMSKYNRELKCHPSDACMGQEDFDAIMEALVGGTDVLSVMTGIRERYYEEFMTKYH